MCVDRHRASGFSSDCYAVGITAKGGNVVAHPPQSSDLVEQTEASTVGVAVRQLVEPDQAALGREDDAFAVDGCRSRTMQRCILFSYNIKWRPVIGMEAFTNRPTLGSTQGVSRTNTIAIRQCQIEVAHEFYRRFIVNVP